MGQNQIKAGLKIRSQARSIVDGISNRLSTVAELKSLTYDQFLHEVDLLNRVVEDLTKDSDKTVHFGINPGTENHLLWKATTKITCDKILRVNMTVLSSKLLSVRRFIRLYGDIMHQMSAASSASAIPEAPDTESEFCASLILDGLETSSLASSQYEEECCICMEKYCELILACTHGFCEECIDKWSERSDTARLRNQDTTCPICRIPLEQSKNHWVLTSLDTPQTGEVPGLVLGLVDRAEGRRLNLEANGRPHSLPNVGTPPLKIDRPNSIGASMTTSCDDNLFTSTNTDEGYTLISHTTDS